ncbi:MAG: 2-oxo-4-hydroxy-4-carboxy-5-ureidoimidazoline decarboxylase [Chloroflexia bacterium]|nr:2-oxo-4-hydroxy-4-carboxy-5-ureidoimidazoline decarboxylase [Chloroflexia bacterium]
MTSRPRTIAEINALDRDAFVATLGGLFDGSPWVAAETWPARPFADLVALHRGLCGAMRAERFDRHLTLIRAHPDLVGRAALAGTLTRESTGEQAAAGLDPGPLTAAEIEVFAIANTAYTERFGFPFVICAREQTKETILAGLAARLANSREAEIATALGEIERIAWYRLVDVVGDDEGGAR